MASIGHSKDSHKRDLIHLTGPLTREAILRQLHENFMEGYCYVRAIIIIYIYIYILLLSVYTDLDWTCSPLCESL